MLRYLPFLLSLALTVYCLIDAAQTDETAVRTLPKIAWILLILLVPLVGPVAWLVAGRPLKTTATPARAPQEPWQSPRQQREQERRNRPPRGPDDDPDFLKDL